MNELTTLPRSLTTLRCAQLRSAVPNSAPLCPTPLLYSVVLTITVSRALYDTLMFSPG